MLQHLQETQTDSRLNAPVNPNAASNQRVESYLNLVCAPFDAILDKGEADNLRGEMRCHIESLVEAHLELGDSQEQAVEHALEQFGNTYTIQREWKRTSSTASTMKDSIVIGLGLNAGGSLAAAITISLGLRSMFGYGWPLAGLLCPLAVYVLPVVLGLVTGIIAKRKPMLATLYSLLLLLLPMTVLDANLSEFLVHHAFRVGSIGEWATLHVLWIPLGCAGAGIVSLVRWLKHGPRRIVIAW